MFKYIWVFVAMVVLLMVGLCAGCGNPVGVDPVDPPPVDPPPVEPTFPPNWPQSVEEYPCEVYVGGYIREGHGFGYILNLQTFEIDSPFFGDGVRQGIGIYSNDYNPPEEPIILGWFQQVNYEHEYILTPDVSRPIFLEFVDENYVHWSYWIYAIHVGSTGDEFYNRCIISQPILIQ
jgi:hypothetical protein